MKKLLLTLPLFLGLVLNLSAIDDHFSNLNDAQKLALSEAYQAVSEHFIKNGEEARGAAYEKTAEILLGQIADLSTAAAELQKGTQVTNATGEEAMDRTVSEDEQKAVGYYFRKLVRSLLSENSEKVLSQLDEPLAMDGYLSGIPREKLESDLEYFFLSYDMTAFTPSDLYDMENISFSYSDHTNEVIVVEVRAVADDTNPMGLCLFWKDVQNFYFRKADRGWKLFAIL
jgi:hypothetical protein